MPHSQFLKILGNRPPHSQNSGKSKRKPLCKGCAKFQKILGKFLENRSRCWIHGFDEWQVVSTYDDGEWEVVWIQGVWNVTH